MTTRDRFDGVLSSWLHDQASAPIRSVDRDHVLATITTRRTRRARLASLGSHWITDPTARGAGAMFHPVVGVSPTLMVALPLLALALLGTAAILAGQSHETTMATPVPGSPLPSNHPTSSARLREQLFPDARRVAVGPLTAATYHYVDVDGSGINAQFTVPDGWTWDGRSLRKDGEGRAGGAAILFYGKAVDVQVYADPCRWAAGASMVDPYTIDGVVAALARQPSRSPTIPPNLWTAGVNIPDSSRGLMVDLIVPVDLDLASCDGGEYRSWTIGEVSRSHDRAGQRDSVSIIDIYGIQSGTSEGAKGGMIIDAASFPNTSPTVMAEIDAILDSIFLGHWG